MESMSVKTSAQSGNSVKPPFTISTYLIIVFGVGLVVTTMFLSRKSVRPQKKEIYQVDLEKVFSQHNHLRMDEKEVLKFIANAKEGVFVSELRKRFDLPKSSAWRMMRRLEGEGIIITKSVGRETFVQMKPAVM